MTFQKGQLVNEAWNFANYLHTVMGWKGRYMVGPGYETAVPEAKKAPFYITQPPLFKDLTSIHGPYPIYKPFLRSLF